VSDETSFNVRLYGENADSAEAIGQVLSGMDGLFKAIAEAQGLDPEQVKLSVGRMRWVCDGCGCERPDDHSDWTHRDGEDFCAACSAKESA
jgi:hypothetical protein